MQFSFGKNWQSFTHHALNKEKIAQARVAFRSLLGDIDMAGKSFLDIGFGQGLGLVLADEMGAEVLGIDNDVDNLKALQRACAACGMHRMPQTRIGSILDREFLHRYTAKDGYDLVHAWGVLHHTGNMVQSIHNAAGLVKKGGTFVCAIYNRHWSSPIWKIIKRIYMRSPQKIQRALIVFFFPIIYMAKWATTGEHPEKMDRGMDFYHNVVDWVGGYPYEYADPEDVVKRVCRLGFECIRFRPARVPTGCNEFIFRRLPFLDGHKPGFQTENQPRKSLRRD